ncbi:hypothetical protein GF380_01455 [Candidatus Uhrbacteria bacterium]|nr:hypothetical protein [Candidatus Uhrbacteria bacterium]MBD3283946.1 hypothetical protein [Candidatus Uhrbacteria bacterium]
MNNNGHHQSQENEIGDTPSEAVTLAIHLMTGLVDDYASSSDEEVVDFNNASKEVHDAMRFLCHLPYSPVETDVDVISCILTELKNRQVISMLFTYWIERLLEAEQCGQAIEVARRVRDRFPGDTLVALSGYFMITAYQPGNEYKEEALECIERETCPCIKAIAQIHFAIADRNLELLQEQLEGLAICLPDRPGKAATVIENLTILQQASLEEYPELYELLQEQLERLLAIAYKVAPN